MKNKRTSEMTQATRTVMRDGQVIGRRIGCYKLRMRSPGGSEEHVFSSPVVRAGSRKGNDLVIPDETVSRVHFEIVADARGYRLRDLGSTNGTTVDGYLAADIYLKPGSVIGVGSVEITFRPTGAEEDIPLFSGDCFGPAIGQSAAMREVFAVLDRVSATDVTVLVEGETGTGKEVVAHAIHEASDRAGGPFVVFDCAAVPADLFESELFGHERGAFSGAVGRRVGRLEEAAGGTLVLDEIGELPLDMQPKLLRAVETRTLRRVGGSGEIPVDVRLVAATNRDLASEVNRGAFRADLYYRLAVVRVSLPPLRERLEDVRPLAEHFIRRTVRNDPAQADSLLKSIPEETWTKLVSHSWPGNARELRNVIERSLALRREDEAPAIPGLRSDPPDRRDSTAPVGIDLERPYSEVKRDWLERFDRSYLNGQLARHDGNISRAARASGLERMHFKRILKKYR